MHGYVPTKTARKLLGVTTTTLRTWDKTGKIHTVRSPSGARLYSSEDIYNVLGFYPPDETKKKVVYCRVSTKKQMDDLGRQVDFFKSTYPNHELVTDVGSGINWKRKGFTSILELAMSGHLEELVVAHRDQLCRFAFELVEFILSTCKVKLIVLESDTSKSSDQELADDILSIINIYSDRGKRRYKNKDSKNPSPPKSDSDTTA